MTADGVDPMTGDVSTPIPEVSATLYDCSGAVTGA
jgi:hypothetical protein